MANGATVTATRHLNFLLREVQGDRAADYNAFVRAVQGDEAQEFTLEQAEVASQQTKPENSKKKINAETRSTQRRRGQSE
jgi:hypothetical protein